jgi:protein-tyrosine phosphatase
VIDLHSHVLPGLDDGPRDVAGSLEILDAAAADGIATIAATPHVTDEYPTSADAMEAALAELAALGHDVEVLPGAELDIRRAAELDDAELRRFGLGGNPRLLLLEMPYDGWPLDLPQLLLSLQARGFTLVLAHPERNQDVADDPERLRPLVERGVVMQVTAAAVDGRLGGRAQKSAHTLIERGLAHLLASDGHAASIRAIGMREATRTLHDDALGRWLTEDVPAALLAGEQLPARPATRRTMRLPWHR